MGNSDKTDNEFHYLAERAALFLAILIQMEY
jgi:hypothetical protein